MNEFGMCRGSGVTLSKRNVIVDIKVSDLSDLIANRIS